MEFLEKVPEQESIQVLSLFFLSSQPFFLGQALEMKIIILILETGRSCEGKECHWHLPGPDVEREVSRFW